MSRKPTVGNRRTLSASRLAAYLSVTVAAVSGGPRSEPLPGPVQWVDMAGVRLSQTASPRPPYTTNSPPRAFLGSDQSGAVYVGCSGTSSSWQEPRVWQLGYYVPNDKRVWAKTNMVAAVSRRATDFWVLGRPGLFRLRGAKLETVDAVHGVNAPPVMGHSAAQPPPRVMGAEEVHGSALAVDAEGVAWVLDPSGAAPWAYIEAPAGGAAAQSTWYVACFNPPNAARSAIARHPGGGVWLYTPPTRDVEQSLLHLQIEGRPPDARIAVADDTPRFDDMPGVAYPHMTVTADGHVFIVGQTLEGDRLIEVREGVLTSQLIPHDLLRGRHITALDADTRGRLYLATDGAGVLTCHGGEWAVHGITKELACLAGSDLKPADDVLVADDGTLYVGCQTYLAIWPPGPDQP